MEQMKKQSEAFGTKIINDYVTDVNFSKFPFEINTEKEKYFSYSVIIATGAKAKWLGVPGEDELKDLVYLLVQHVTDSFSKKKCCCCWWR